MPQNPFQGLEVAGQPAEKPRRVYSFTQDVRQFEICPIRYHRYRVQQYTEPPDYHVLLGDVVHRCIHALCSDYLGKGDHPAGVIPSDARVEQHLERQKLALKYQNINLSLQDQLEARRIVHAWNKAVGPELYPRIIETEFPLEEKLEHYDLRGIPDLLLHGKGRNSTKPEIYELKTRHKPKNRDEADQRQLQLYVHLYHQQYGIVPSRAFVYYLRDLDSSQPEGPACDGGGTGTSAANNAKAPGADNRDHRGNRTGPRHRRVAKDAHASAQQRTMHRLPPAAGLPSSKELRPSVRRERHRLPPRKRSNKGDQPPQPSLLW